ncbi:hypothetical protein A2U01_0080363, partial [Trifolium medium]|nr:hypothetical protein [Trifolium medium]
YPYMVEIYRDGVDGLEAVCMLRLNCLGSHSTGAPSTFEF